MKLLKQIQLLVVLSVLCCTCFGAEEPFEPAKQELKFNVSDKPWSSIFPRSGKSTHVAGFQLRNMKNWKSPYISEKSRRQLSIGDWRGVVSHVEFRDEGAMAGPREFVILSNFKRKPRRTKKDIDEEFEERRRFEEYAALGIQTQPSGDIWLYADSAEQAQELAKVFIERVSGLADAHVREVEARQKLRLAEVARLETKIPQVQNALSNLKQKLDGYKEKIYYRNARDAKSSILQWNTLLNQVEVDIIGIRAKLDRIKEFEKKETERFARDSLHSMKMAEEVELAGALARKDATQSHREKAQEFLDLTGRVSELQNGLQNDQRKLSNTRGDIAKVEKWLSQEKTEMKPVEVVDNEVTIYPLPLSKD
jgi:hypothetical protein